MAKRRNTMFGGGKPKHPSIAKKVTIKTPAGFRESVRQLKKGGLSTAEKRALVLAKNRAGAQLKRKNLSSLNRKQFREIKNTRLPSITK